MARKDSLAIMKIIKFAEELYQELVDSGIEFSEEGYPIITEDMLLKELPEQILPFGQTYAAKDKSKTLLVSFCNDEIVYKKLLSLKNDVSEYQKYLGFGGFDLSPRINWDIHLQRFNIALNMMADVYLAIHGVKLMPNFRTGCLSTMNVLLHYPRNTWFTVGALGCARGRVKLNTLYLCTKLLLCNPDMLVYYGKLKAEYATILDDYGVDYVVYPDFQRVSRRKEV